MSNQGVDEPTPTKRSLFSTGGRKPKDLPLVALLLACLFVLSADEVRAEGFVFTLNDSDSPSPSISVSGTSSASTITSYGCTGETCSITETANSGWISLGFPPPATYLFEPGTTTISDEWFNHLSEGGAWTFYSDPSTFPVSTCPNAIQCTDETALPISQVLIDWTNALTGDTIDYVNVQSDLDPVTTPEPSSIMLLLTGFAGLGITKLRGKVVAGRKWLG